ncbi:MAG: hypothetical protein HFJ06_12735 [Lachnospiraceae bacterium]|nr:hypothetical protein [Lachnospiraceae bacterium]
MLDLGYVTKGLWSEEDMEGLAQQAMCELYDLTGTQVEECYYYATDIGCFCFAMSKEDMDHSRNFCMRQFSDDERVIPSIYVANAKQVSYSVVDMLALPEGYERMTEADRAEWFVTHSGLYNGQSVKAVYQPYDWDYRINRCRKQILMEMPFRKRKI